MREIKEILHQTHIELVQNICSRMIEKVVDGKRGITLDQHEALVSLHGRYKSLLAYYKHPERLSKNKKNEIQALLDEGISSQNAYVGFELADALVATFDYLNCVDSVALKNHQRIEEAELDKAVVANVELSDFFIKIGNRFGFKDELRQVYKTIFADVNTQREFSGTGLNNFPSGVYGVIEGYIIMRHQFPTGKLRAGTFMEDKCFATDMVWEPFVKGSEPEKICEIKASSKLTETKLFDLNVSFQVAEVKQLNERFDAREYDRRMHSLSMILIRSQEIQAHPYWIETPSVGNVI